MGRHAAIGTISALLAASPATWMLAEDRPVVEARSLAFGNGPVPRRAGACLATGSSNSRFYASYGVARERIVATHYSVHSEFSAASGGKGRIRRAELQGNLGLDPALPTVRFAAKLQLHKWSFDVLAVVARMRQPVNVPLIGDDPLRPEVDAQARELFSAHLLGFRKQPEIGQWYGLNEVMVAVLQPGDIGVGGQRGPAYRRPSCGQRGVRPRPWRGADWTRCRVPCGRCRSPRVRSRPDSLSPERSSGVDPPPAESGNLDRVLHRCHR
jgi:hypothetical protein